MTCEDKKLEQVMLLKRVFPLRKLFKIGKDLGIDYFDCFKDEWEIDDDQAALEIANKINDSQIREVFDKQNPRDWVVFRGKNYTFEDGQFKVQGSWNSIRSNIRQFKEKYGKNGHEILRRLAEAGKSCDLEEIVSDFKKKIDYVSVLKELEQLKVVVVSYIGDEYQEWRVLEETVPLILSELGVKKLDSPASVIVSATGSSEGISAVDHIISEKREIEKMDSAFDEYLNNLLKHRIDSTVKFGKKFSISALASYLQNMFGSLLYFDGLLSITQQYGLANTEIGHQYGKTGMRTGWNLSLFGEPGTGKSFSTRDLILGRPDAKIFPHGLPGRNRYAGGMTPARFVRIGQAYNDRVFNFIVPEFNDWFKYKGMVEPLKLAMERGEIRYELHNEVVGPYRFNSFFSVNYNVTTNAKGYEVTAQDPNFNAIEDRMLCRLHRLTKKRFVEIAQSQMRLAFGEISTKSGAEQIREHLALVYAIETEHPLVNKQFPLKQVIVTHEAFEIIKKARDTILEHIPREVVPFSARLEDRAMRFACAASLLNYFNSNLDYIPVSKDALKYATQLYVEEASVRSRQEFKPEEVLTKIL